MAGLSDGSYMIINVGSFTLGAQALTMSAPNAENPENTHDVTTASDLGKVIGLKPDSDGVHYWNVVSSYDGSGDLKKIMSQRSNKVLSVFDKTDESDKYVPNITRDPDIYENVYEWDDDQVIPEDWDTIASKWGMSNPKETEYILESDYKIQNWYIETGGGSAEYLGTEYPTYKIHMPLKLRSSGNLIYPEVEKVDFGDIYICWGGENNIITKQLPDPELGPTFVDGYEWIFVPVSASIDDGFYEIRPLSELNASLDIQNSSTSSNSPVILQTRRSSNSQIFKVVQNGVLEHFPSAIMNINSNRYIEVASNKSITQNGTVLYSAQPFFFEFAGLVHLNGELFSVYRITTAPFSDTVIGIVNGYARIVPRSEALSQRFLFFKTIMYGQELELPGRISPLNIPGSIGQESVVGGLKFTSYSRYFQARYKARMYSIGRVSYTETNWMNVRDDSILNEGWGNIEEPDLESFESIYHVPSLQTLYTLTSQNPEIDFIFETREFVYDYGLIDDNFAGIAAYGPSQQSVVTMSDNRMGMVLEGIGFKRDRYESELDLEVSIRSEAPWYYDGYKYFEGQLFGEDGAPITTKTYVGAKNVPWMVYSVDEGMLYRFPKHNERLGFEYHMILKNGNHVYGTLYHVFEWGAFGDAADPFVGFVQLTKSTDGSKSVIASVEESVYGKCYMVVPYMDRTRVIPCPEITVDKNHGTHMAWRLLPPLNQRTDVVFMVNDPSVEMGNWRILYTSCLVDSHESIWNWTTPELGGTESNPYSEFAALLLNTDAPPQQTRSFETGINYQSPVGRVHPVGFSSINLKIDMSVEGIAVDDDANYDSIAPLPQHTSVRDIQKLVPLSGQGIHPIYRTPYGDWYQVGIESVDVSKSEFGKSSVSVTQSVVED